MIAATEARPISIGLKCRLPGPVARVAASGDAHRTFSIKISAASMALAKIVSFKYHRGAVKTPGMPKKSFVSHVFRNTVKIAAAASLILKS